MIDPQLITEILPEIVVAILGLSGAASAMAAINSDERVRNDYKHTYNYLIFLLVVLIIDILVASSKGVMMLTGTAGLLF